MIYSILISGEADKKINAHIEFLARVSVRASLRLGDTYRATLRFIAENAESCPKYFSEKPINFDLRYKFFAKRYRIVFDVWNGAVYIHDIQDCRQNPANNLI